MRYQTTHNNHGEIFCGLYSGPFAVEAYKVNEAGELLARCEVEGEVEWRRASLFGITDPTLRAMVRAALA